MQKETEFSPVTNRLSDSPSADSSHRVNQPGTDFANDATEADPAALNLERGPLLSQAGLPDEVLALLSAVIRRMEQLEAKAKEQGSVLRNRTERLDATTEELRQIVLEHASRVNRELDAAQMGFHESIVRSLATLRRPVRDVRWRSLLGTLRRYPLRKIWRLAKDYKLLASSPLFDRNWYLGNYQDIRKAGFDPVLHYLVLGAAEGRLPGPDFDAPRYLAANPDVREAGANPLVHFLRHGVFERRSLGLAGYGKSRISDSSSARVAGDTEGVLRRERPRPIKARPQLWHYIGDSIEWLKEHQQLTGVGKVSTELLLASLEFVESEYAVPCVFGNSSSGLVPASLQDCEALLRRIGLQAANGSSIRMPAYNSRITSPEAGDHIFFSGLVWTPTFNTLFKKLAHENIEFSVLVFDIIQIESPELVGEEAHKSFSEWLATTVTHASVIYVSGQLSKDKILRWAVLSGLEVRAEIVLVAFGLRPVTVAFSREELARNELTSNVDLGGFVLSVGTIDQRKNQILLCRIWQGLADRVGAEQLPQLVLAGRDDLGLPQSATEFEPLFAAGKIIVLQGLSDAQLAGLYQQCLFTAFPSLSEGYGLPVAESLLYGKLCLSSNLPVVREHSGDLVWYFSPDNFEDALALFTRAIQDPEFRLKAELRISREFHPPGWAKTYQTVVTAAKLSLREPLPEVVPGPQCARYPGAVEVEPVRALVKAATWCTSDNPDVSILIINWNAARLTVECIRQIWAHTDGYTYEIIIADNGSSSGDARRLRNLGSGIRLLELGCNRFFGEANNIAAEEARGRYLCFLNNDAFVQPGWLTALVAALDENQEVGAAGPMFLFPDGLIQEAGGTIDPGGYPIRFGRGEKQGSADVATPRFVDYISAATLLTSRKLFLEAGGFDLAYEPAYYEDADLCLKIRALGKRVKYCPNAKVIHIEGQAANDDPIAEARRKALGDLNREKFVSRWREYLRHRDEAVLPSLAPQVSAAGLYGEQAPFVTTRPSRTAAVYTPYLLTPGGGESYLFTTAVILAERYDVSVVTPRRYSRLRLQNLGRELAIDLSRLSLITEEEFLRREIPDLMVTMGNHIVPSIEGRGKHNIYLCQFPFQADAVYLQAHKLSLDSYETILVYSDYARAHVYAGLSAYCLPAKPIAVVHPPVLQIHGDAADKKNIILSVGRFFMSGHSKRHDLLIEVFKSIAPWFDQAVELHLAGSSVPDPQQMDYLAQLIAAAEGYPIHFHVNPSSEQLQLLYREAAVYWHGTGLGTDLYAAPEKAEHFGISLVEAMSAEVVPFSLAAGGPREIIENGETGFLYNTTDQLAKLTLELFAPTSRERREAIGRAASRRAAQYSRDDFRARINELVDKLVESAESNATL